MMRDGLILMIAGMGTVFIFLIIQVAVMNMTANLFKRFEKPEPVSSHLDTLKADDSTEIAVALAAIAQYRKR